jgi:ABC-2 type transport system permease protein
MKRLWTITTIEFKLVFRDPATWGVALLLPAAVLLILGALPSLRTPQAVFGGQRFIDVFVPSLVVVTLATLGVNALPIRLATERERGVLRRLFTTPVHPAWLLTAQLVVNLALAVAAVALLIVVGRLAFGVPLPRHPWGFALAFGLGTASVFALGLLVAAVAPSARAGSALSMPLYFLTMFLGGAYLPRVFLPGFLVRLGAYAPPGVQPMLDAWMGTAPQPAQLAVLAAITLAASAGAAWWFRWE